MIPNAKGTVQRWYLFRIFFCSVPRNGSTGLYGKPAASACFLSQVCVKSTMRAGGMPNAGDLFLFENAQVVKGHIENMKSFQQKP